MSDNKLLYVETLGTGEQSIVFIHGFGVSRKSWHDIVPYFKDKYELHLIDLMGCGDSPSPEKWDYSIENQADAVLNVLTKKKLKDIILVAHSFGAGVSIILNHKLKQQQQDLIKKIIFISPAAYHQPLPFFIKIPSIPILNRVVLNILPPKYQVRKALERTFFNKDLVTDERVSRYVDNITNRSKRKAFIKSSENLPPKFSKNEIEGMIDEIDVEVIILYGDHDNVIPKENVYRLNNALIQSELILFNECGHVPQEEYPEKTAKEIIAFIEVT